MNSAIKSSLKILLFTGSSLASCGMALAQTQTTPAQGEAAAPQSGEAAEDRGLEDIVVTATRRSESLIRVPLAIQAVTADALTKQGATKIEDLQNSVPGLTIQYGSGGFIVPYLRGVGNALPGSYAESSIAIYLDDVPRPRQSSSTELVNLERVEVLKGPQGALYGRNATGGAINIVTKEPNFEPELYGRLSGGEKGTLEAAAYVNVPLNDKIAVNASVTHRQHNGFMDNRAPGAPQSDLDTLNTDSIDAKIKFNVSEAFTFTLRGDYTWIDDTLSDGWVQVNPAKTSAVTSVPLAFLQVGSGQARFTYSDQDVYRRLKDRGVSGKAELDLGIATITSITAYRQNRQTGSIEIDATALPIAGFRSRFYSNTFSQEVRAVSTGTGPLQWIVGASYFDDKINDTVFGVVGGQENPLYNLTSNLRVKAYAVFGQLSYKATDNIELIGSLRYTNEKRDITYPAQAAIPFDVRGNKKEHAVLPSATINFTLPSDLGIVYARYAKGFKSGGINNLLNPLAPDSNGDPLGINTFAPESLYSYELGYKAELFDRRARITLSAFHYDYRNLQVSRTGGPTVTSFILNAKKARINGIEAELAVKVLPELTLSGGASYTDATYRDYTFGGNPALGIAAFDNDGNRMISTPKYQLQAMADVNVPINDRLIFASTGSVSYRSSFYFDAENTAEQIQKAYAVFNGRIGIRDASDKFGLYLFANNIFNKTYAVYGQTNSVGSLLAYGSPRIVGVTSEIRF